MLVSEMLEIIGSEVTWEFLQCEDRWFVWATHHGEDDCSSFKFTAADKFLGIAVRDVFDQLQAGGPDWIRKLSC